jgi:transcriptional regulator with XRE-family HTH domain
MPPSGSPDLALAQAIRAIRESQGRSQESVAYAAGISVNALRRVEYGKSNPTWTTVRLIVDALSVSLAELELTMKAAGGGAR